MLNTETLVKNIHYNEVGTAGELSNKIKFMKSNTWKLTEAIDITAIIRGVEQESEVQASE